MDLYEPLSSGEEEELEPILENFPPLISHLPYTPLDHSKNEIRLLELSPAHSRSDDIECQMDTYSLDDDPTYSALSYPWAAERLARGVVNVNNHVAVVTKNLSDALYCLRERGVQRVWVDALCIHQSNDEEKAYQVQKMGMIYQRARNVLSWIGLGDEDSERGIHVMRRIASLSQTLQLGSVLDPYHGGVSFERRRQVMENLYGALSNDPWLREGDIMLAFSLMNRESWGRLWVIQEISLARSATILCGTSQISWDEWQRAMAVFSWLRALSTEYPSRSSAFAEGLVRTSRSYGFDQWKQPPAVWISARLRSNGKSGVQLFHLLDDTCNDTILGASDPRDRVFALLGLVCEDDQKDILVDYASPVPTVFTRATLLLLHRHGARVLMYSGLAHLHQDDDPLPSWVIDWSCTEARATGLLGNPMRDNSPTELVRIVGHEQLALRAAVRTRVVACFAFSSFPDTVTTFLERVQDLIQARQLPMEDLATLKRTVWHALLHRHYPPSLSMKEIDDLFENYLQNDTAIDFIQLITTHSTDTIPHSAPSSGHEKAALNDHSADHQPSLRFQDLLNNNKHARSLFVTEDGSIGTGPVMTKEGDVLCAFPDCDVPFLLRSEDIQKHGRRWKLVGPVHVEGMVSTEGDGYFTMRDFWSTNPDLEKIVLS